jgi:hypothetical protein
MMRIQYNALVEKLYRLVDEELEMSTNEGDQVFRALSQALFVEFVKNKKKA